MPLPRPSREGFRQLRWIGIAFLVLTLVGLLGQMRLWPHTLKGRTAPDFTLPKLAQGTWTLSDETAQVIVLDFWATWCAPCMVALPRLEQIQHWAEDQNKSVAVYCINVSDQRDRIEDLWKQKELTMPVLTDSVGTVAEAYQVNTFPTTFVIADGHVEQAHVGTRSLQVPTLQRQIESLLN